RSLLLSTVARDPSVGLLRSLCSLRADRVGEPPTSLSLGDESVSAPSSSARWRAIRASDCSARYARSARIASGSRLLRCHSGTKACPLPPPQHGGARSERRIAPLAMLAPRGSRRGAAYFVVTRGRKRVRSLLLSTVARDPSVGLPRALCSLRGERFGEPPPSSSLGDESVSAPSSSARWRAIRASDCSARYA